VLELAHGCVSCTLRLDLLPVVRRLALRQDVERIVLHLDPALEPELVCWAVLQLLVDGTQVADAVQLRGVITVLDSATWLDFATSRAELTERGIATLPGDDRTVAQLVVGQAEFADLLVLAGTAEPWQHARTDAVLADSPRSPRD
jgi:G3E family GTPase